MEFIVTNSNVDLIACRACTTEMNKYEMFNLFTEPNLSNIFLQCISIKIIETDELPEFMCPDCNYQLNQLNDFRQKCHTSDAYFRQRVKTENGIKIEPFSPENEEDSILNIAKLDTEPSEVSLKLQDRDREQLLKPPLKILINDYGCSYNKVNHFDDGSCTETEIKKVPTLKRSKNKRKSIREESKTEFVCDICNEKFCMKNLIEAHLRAHVGLDPYFCENCDKSFMNRESYEHHIEQNHKNKHEKYVKHFCKICGKMFYNKLRLDGHIRQHSGLKPFQCDICNREYSKLTRLKHHHRIEHSEDGTYERIPCTHADCSKTFNYRENLKSHIKFYHEKKFQKKKPMPLVCDVCGKSVANSFLLKEHVYKHTGEKPFECERCPKKFASNRRLKLHTLRHNNIRNFVCTICGESFVTNNDLQRHLNIHTKEKTWPCPTCEKVFNSYANKNQHMRVVHLGIKAYKCPHCELSFGKPDTLKHHVMRHTGEKPYACSVCEKKFIQSVALKAHMKVHNKQNT